MKIFVHFPTKAEELRQLETIVAKMQADIVLWKIQNINCSQQQKSILLGGIIRDLMKSEALKSSIHARFSMAGLLLK